MFCSTASPVMPAGVADYLNSIKQQLAALKAEAAHLEAQNEDDVLHDDGDHPLDVNAISIDAITRELTAKAARAEQHESVLCGELDDFRQRLERSAHHSRGIGGDVQQMGNEETTNNVFAFRPEIRGTGTNEKPVLKKAPTNTLYDVEGFVADTFGGSVPDLEIMKGGVNVVMVARRRSEGVVRGSPKVGLFVWQLSSDETTLVGLPREELCRSMLSPPGSPESPNDEQVGVVDVVVGVGLF